MTLSNVNNPRDSLCQVLFVSLFGPSGRESASNRLRKHSKALSEKGVETSWLFAEGTLLPAAWLREAISCDVDGATDEKISSIRKVSLRGCAFLKMTWKAASWLRRNPNGRVIVSVPPLFIFCVGIFLQMFWPKRVFWDFRDPIVNRKLQKRFLGIDSLIEILQKLFLPRSGAIFIASPGIAAFLPQNCKPVVLLSGIEPRTIASAPNQKDVVKVLYGGSFYGSRSPVPMLDALIEFYGREIPKQKIEVEIFASWPDSHQWDLAKKRIAAADLSTKVHLRRLALGDEYRVAAGQADLIWAVTHDEGTDYAIPGKVFDAVEMHKPLLLTTSDDSLLQWLRHQGIPFLNCPNQKEPILNLLRELSERLELLNKNLDDTFWMDLQNKLSTSRQAEVVLALL